MDELRRCITCSYWRSARRQAVPGSGTPGFCTYLIHDRNQAPIWWSHVWHHCMNYDARVVDVCGTCRHFSLGSWCCALDIVCGTPASAACANWSSDHASRNLQLGLIPDTFARGVLADG